MHYSLPLAVLQAASAHIEESKLRVHYVPYPSILTSHRTVLEPLRNFLPTAPA
jgi:hypothetical protein